MCHKDKGKLQKQWNEGGKQCEYWNWPLFDDREGKPFCVLSDGMEEKRGVVMKMECKSNINKDGRRVGGNK